MWASSCKCRPTLAFSLIAQLSEVKCVQHSAFWATASVAVGATRVLPCSVVDVIAKFAGDKFFYCKKLIIFFFSVKDLLYLKVVPNRSSSPFVLISASSCDAKFLGKRCNCTPFGCVVQRFGPFLKYTLEHLGGNVLQPMFYQQILHVLKLP